ncbi:ATP-binding protein [Roseovarius sp. SYSU LYC5161]|uniref:ATP-binding protein n=1 Tax=Roseovarius halophilus (ex Wu et al. 2025) TaxID=3376060 RepID=UPI0039998A43
MARWKQFVGVLTLLLAEGILVLVFQQLSEKLEKFSFARSDNDAWNFAQVEVAFSRFQTALQAGLIDVRSDGQQDPANAAEIRKQFNLFYARVDTVAERYDMFQSQPMTNRLLQQVQDARDRLTPVIDADAFMTGPQLRAMLKTAEDMRPEIRDFALAAMHTAIENQESERVKVHASLRQSILTLTGLVLVLLVLGGVLAYLWRTLASKNASERNLVAYLAKLIEVSSDGIVVVDRDLRITDLNRTAERMFGVDHASLRGANVVDTLGPRKHKGAMKKRLQAILNGKRDPENEIRRVPIIASRKDGTNFPAELSVVRVRDQSREKVLVGFLRDLSAERHARLAARRALAQARNEAAAKQRFLATMSHEIRTPLHSIVVATEMTQAADPSSTAAGYLPTVKAAAQTALQQVEDVLEIAKDAERQPPQVVEDLDARAVVYPVFLQMQPLARSRGNRLIFDWPDRALVTGSSEYLSKVVHNLVSNAIKATEDGLVTIRGSTCTREGRPVLQLEIADTGIGMGEAEQTRIFEDFVSGFRTSETTGSGTGLGLGIVKRALASLNGRIELESTPGQGTVFRVIVPLSVHQDILGSDTQHAEPPASAAKEEPAQISTVPLTAGKVLVVEDHDTNRHLLETMLSKSGYSVTTAADGLTGLAMAVDTGFDLILTDINMPKLSGDGVARCLRHSSVSGDACIIAVTAKATIATAREASITEGGIDAFLFKPFDSARLNDAIRDALDERAHGVPGTKGLTTGPAAQDAPFPADSNEAMLTPSLVAGAFHDMQALLERMPDPARAEETPTAFDELGKFAHYVAGSLLFMGYQRLGAALQDLERMCHERDLQGLYGMKIVLDVETERLFQGFRAETASA